MMEIPCPRCNSPQKFGNRYRRLEGDVYEIFMRCSKCQWEVVLDRGTAKELRIKNDLKKLKHKALKSQSSSLFRVINRRHNSLRRERDK